MAERRIAMVAGEPSGDLLASLLLKGLHARLPGVEAYGIGGSHLQAIGFRSDWPMETLSVHGYWDALKRYRAIKRIRDELGDALLASPPDLFIGTDAPDFNLGLEQRLVENGIKTVHFVSPSIWAWRGGRIARIRRSAGRVLCLFPFEPAIYQAAGIAATYVGHPLADVIPLTPDPAAARARLSLPSECPVVAVLPGSRQGEMARLGPTFLAAIVEAHRREPGITFVVPMATPALEAQFSEIKAEVNGAEALKLVTIIGRSHDAIEASDAVLVASGTATLECALYKKPMVIAYRVAWLSYQLMRHMAYLPWIGLPNILLRETLVPELVQDAATPAALATALLTQLQDEQGRQRLEARFLDLHVALRQDTGRRAAEAILDVLGTTIH